MRDLRYALRTLAKSPGYAAAAMVTLALGIGANTAIFSVVHGVLLRSLSYRDPDRVVQVREANARGHQMNLCDPNFRDMAERNRSFQAFAEWNSGPESISGGSEPVRLPAATVSREFFAALGVQPVLGRTFVEEELATGGAPAVIVSHGFWQRFLGSDPDLSKAALRFHDDLYRVVGVMPPGFAFPPDAELWTARERMGPDVSRSAHNWWGLARLRDGVSLAAARADLQSIAARIKSENGDTADLAGVAITPLRDALVGRVRPALLLLTGAVGFLMLLAGANVANLALARSAARRRELAIRAALGAGRIELLRVVLTETLVVAIAGGAGGALLCVWSLGAVRSLAAASLPRASEIALNLPVLAFALALSLAAALAIALTASRRRPESRLKDLAGGRGSGGASETMRAQGVLVGVQAAVTALLLFGLALFSRSFLHILDAEPGFRAQGVLAMDLFPARPGTDAATVRRVALLDRLLERLAAIRGVEMVGAVASLPLGSEIADGTLLVLEPGQEPPRTIPEFERLFRDPSHTAVANYCPASAGYFSAMRIPLVRGRFLDERDGPSGVPAALISESLARVRWPGRDPIGATIEFGNMDGDTRPLTIVGVVGDVRQQSLESAPEPTVYVSFRQRPQAAYALTTVLRINADPSSVITAARAAVHEIDPTLPPRFRALDAVVSESLSARRFSLTLLAVFGALALLLATSGIASVTAYAVARRRPELGLRMALGARPSDLIRSVVTSHLRVIAIGMASGFAAAAAAAVLLRAQLFGVPPADPWSFGASASILLLPAIVACVLPARQVSRIDPTEALRSE